ncbi:hypothetical protein ACLOJK_013133 [Asimina triloba]
MAVTHRQAKSRRFLAVHSVDACLVSPLVPELRSVKELFIPSRAHQKMPRTEEMKIGNRDVQTYISNHLNGHSVSWLLPMACSKVVVRPIMPMGDSTTAATSPPPPPPPSRPTLLLPAAAHKKKPKPVKVIRLFRSVFKTIPALAPHCKLPSLPVGFPESRRSHLSGSKVTGTLFGYRKGRVSLSVQENPKCLPMLVVELAMQTNVLQKEMSSGMVRIALECEKRSEKEKMKLLEEPMWTMYCNGRKSGYGVKREATEEDLSVMEVLRPVSMGAGVLPSATSEADHDQDAELAYMRAHFERVVGSKDSETLYMLSPDANGPELSIFFVRL